MQGAPASLAALLAGAIDYAGTFPPASLAMSDAADRYDRHRAGPHRVALGRFVVAAGQLDDLAAAAAPLSALPRALQSAGRWPLSVLIAAPFEADRDRIARFNDRYADDAAWSARVEAVEAKAQTPDEVQAAARAAGRMELFVEVPVHPVPLALLEAVREAGARAKIRTGGTTPDAFPPCGPLAAWLAYCASLGLPFKATAGLHHAIRAERPIAAEAGSPRAGMHGFVNLLTAAALLHGGSIDVRTAAAVLGEQDPAAFTFDDERAAWRGHAVPTPELAAARAFAAGFGSCSFDEPIEELAALGLLAAAPPAS
jgi:hypothetical protein